LEKKKKECKKHHFIPTWQVIITSRSTLSCKRKDASTSFGQKEGFGTVLTMKDSLTVNTCGTFEKCRLERAADTALVPNDEYDLHKVEGRLPQRTGRGGKR